MTTRPSLHLCIATGQNLINLIPALQLKASKVVILETPEMTAAASNLKRALESHGIAVKRKAFDDDTEIAFANEAATLYFGGGWLEEYVWLKVRGLRPFDSAVNLMVKPIGAESENELDAEIAHHNRLMVIECKTLRFGRDTAKDSDYIYKLAQLSKQIGGSMGSSILVSARPVDATVFDRARQYGVVILAAADVRNLTSHLREWMK